MKDSDWFELNCYFALLNWALTNMLWNTNICTGCIPGRLSGVKQNFGSPFGAVSADFGRHRRRGWLRGGSCQARDCSQRSVGYLGAVKTDLGKSEMSRNRRLP